MNELQQSIDELQRNIDEIQKDIVCDTALRDKRSAERWRNAWTILLFLVGMAVTAFVVAAVVWFARKDWLVGAATAVGAIVSGAMVGFLVSRRKEAVAEEREAFDRVKENCDQERGEQSSKGPRFFGL